MQLVAYGAQDVYLTTNPQITFWKVVYRRHTNFSMESIEQTFNGQADFGRRVQCTISRNGDLAYRTYLQVTLPQIDASKARWLDYPGEQLISEVEVEIGGQRIDKQYGDWMHIWNQLTMTSEQERAYNAMVGQTTQLTYLTNPKYADVATACSGSSGSASVCAPRKSLPETTLYVPLQFWFCRNPGLALPLIALQYHEVKITLTLRPIDECLWACGSSDTTKDTTAHSKSLVAASLYVDYIFLDTDERRRMAQNPHEYLIEQLQFTGDESIGSTSNKIKLNFNHPCKELVWVVQKDNIVDYCKHYTTNDPVNTMKGAQPFNYTDGIDALPNDLLAFSADADSNAGSFINTSSGLFQDMDASTDAISDYNTTSGKGTDAVGAGVSDAGAFVLAESALHMHCWGSNPVVTAKLQLNGQDRFSEREGSYFDTVQPFQHHTRAPDSGINLYSFALRPEEHQCSGTCNMSRIDNATLHLVVSHNCVNSSDTAKVRVYATNYNVLRIMSGMGGLAYSN